MVGLYDWILHLSEEGGFKNMTALCKAAGVPRANMTELKKGRSAFLSMPSATKMAETLKAPTDYLLGISPISCSKERNPRDRLNLAGFLVITGISGHFRVLKIMRIISQ